MITKFNNILMLLLVFLVQITFAQEKTITGTVLDESGPLPGVSVIIEGTSTGTVTDFDGKYTIKAKAGAVLQFRFMGMETQSKTVGAANVINVTMSGNQMLEEVVVTALGVESKSKSLGYANQTIKASVVERAGQVNAIESLQGSVAGLTINRTSGAAGAGVDILIRGVSSLSTTSNNQPLIIIDGNPVNNTTTSGNVNPSVGSNSPGSNEQFAFSNRSIDINPNDIESYSILKGAGATALYGILAGNGVIIITTKKGKAGKTKVNVSSSISFSEVNKFPELQSVWREGTSSFTGIAPNIVYTYTPRVLSTTANTASGISYYPGFTLGFQTNGPKYSSNDDSSIKFRDFYKDFFNTGINQTLNASVSGGNEKMNYYISASNSIDKGIVPNTDYNRKTFKVHGNYYVSDNFKLGTSITYANSGGTRANTGDKSIMSSLSYWSPSIDINDYLTTSGRQKNWTAGIIDNPRYFAEISNLTDKVDRWIASADMNWQVKSWFNIVYRASVDNFSETRNRYVPKDLDVGTQVGGFIVNENINFRGLNSNLILTANKEFGNFNTTLTVGNQIADNNNLYSGVRGERLIVDGVLNISNTTNKFATNTGPKIDRTVGLFAEAKADYNEILYLGVTARKDEVSTLPKDNRTVNYYSANLAFVFNDLIDKNKTILSFGKLRSSWAQVGKVPPFGVTDRYSTPDSNFPFSGVGGISIGSIAGNPNIKPEIVTTTEFGAELGFLNNRLKIDYTYFDRKSDDQIVAIPTSLSSSITRFWSNVGSLKTIGHEISLSAEIIKKDNFKWVSTVNFTTYDSEILSLPFERLIFVDSGFAGITSEVREGDAAGTFYGLTWKYIDGKRFIGTNGLPVLETNTNGSLKISKVGNAVPDWVGTINNSFKLDNFNLAFLIEYKKGGDAYDAGQRNGIRNGILKITEERNMMKVLEGVKSDGAGGFVPNDIPANISANSYYRTDVFNRASENLLQDASWVKLRNISLSYNLPSDVVSKLKIESASLTLSGSNFLLWTPFRGFDPEGNQFSAGSNTYGFTGLNVPLTQSYSLGVNIGF